MKVNESEKKIGLKKMPRVKSAEREAEFETFFRMKYE